MLKLIKVFLKNFEMISFEKKKAKVFYLLMGLIVALLIFIPAAFIMGTISFGMTTILVDTENSITFGANLLLHCTCIFSFIFSINVILNVFYFSKDLEHLLPLPFKDSDIIGAKFFSTLINENMMEFALIISLLIGFVLGGRIGGFAPVITMIIAVLTAPIVPLVYCGIISIIFMFLTRKVKNRKVVVKLSSFLLIFALMLLIGLMLVLSNVDLEAFTMDLSSSTFMKILNIIFPHVPLLTKAMCGNWLSLLLYIVVIAIAIVIFFIVSKLFYFKGLVTSSSSNKNKQETLEYKVNKPLSSYLRKEFRVLFKTPAFFSNCVIINIIFPFLIGLMAFLAFKFGNLTSILDKFHSGDEMTRFSVLIGVIGVSLLFTAVNSIASSSFSREGAAFYNMKIFPISYKDQLNVKALSSIIITYICLAITIIAVGIIFSLGFVNTLIYLLVSLFGVIFTTYLGLILDSMNPKLVWDDEINALRGNHGVFINMAICMLFSGLLVGLIYLLDKLSLIYVAKALISIFIIIFSAVLIFILANKKCSKFIDRIE